jgi:hypothetical protein
MIFSFNCGSWTLGLLCGLVYCGETSPWWLLLTPVYFLGWEGYNIKLWPRAKAAL